MKFNYNYSNSNSCSGPQIILNTFKISFNKEINYFKEILNIFSDLKPTLGSFVSIDDASNNVDIVLEHPTELAAKETDLSLLFFTETYYDCYVTMCKNYLPTYKFRVIDGFVKTIECLNSKSRY